MVSVPFDACMGIAANWFEFLIFATITRVYASYYGLISPFFASIHYSVDPYLHTFKNCLEIGSYVGATVSASSYCVYAFLSGNNLTKLKEHIDEIQDVLRIKTKAHLAVHQAVLNLLGLENQEKPALLTGKFFDYSRIGDSGMQGCDVARISVTCCMVR